MCPHWRYLSWVRFDRQNRVSLQDEVSASRRREAGKSFASTKNISAACSSRRSYNAILRDRATLTTTSSLRSRAPEMWCIDHHRISIWQISRKIRIRTSTLPQQDSTRVRNGGREAGSVARALLRRMQGDGNFMRNITLDHSSPSPIDFAQEILQSALGFSRSLRLELHSRFYRANV